MNYDNIIPIDQDLTIPKGTTKAYEIQVQQDGAPINITGWVVFFTVKEFMIDTDNDAKIKKTIISHSDPVNGKTVIILDDEDTDITPKSYYYDITIQDDDTDTPENRFVILRGRLTIERTTTRRET
jgi:hypothetical protein